jgi:hypothetical protein
MGCRGVHLALDGNTADRLKAFATDEERLEFVQNDLETEYFDHHREWLAETDVTWDAIHRALTDGRLRSDNGSYPLNHVVLGGQSLYTGDDYVMSLKTPPQVRDIATVLKGFSESQFRAGVMAIDSEDYGFPISEEEYRDGILPWFESLREFYYRAAEAGRYVLFTADQ